MKNRLLPLAAIVAAVLAYALTLVYQRRFERRLTEGMERVQVVVAARQVAAGTVLSKDDIAYAGFLKSSMTRRAVEADRWQDIIGKRIEVSLDRGDPVYWSDLDLPQLERGGLQASITRGERALSIAVDQVSSVTGLVRPNDHVDILGTFTFPAGEEGGTAEVTTLTLLQDVTVIATGSDMGRVAFREGMMGADTAAGRYGTVTLSVTPQEAELLVFAAQQGRLLLTLRNREDIGTFDKLPRVDFRSLGEQLQRLSEERRRRTPGAGSS